MQEMLEYFQKITAVLSAVPPDADQRTMKTAEVTAELLLSELKAKIAGKEKALAPTLDTDFYRALAKQYISLSDKYSFHMDSLYADAANAYRRAIGLCKNPDEKTPLYDELVALYQKFFMELLTTSQIKIQDSGIRHLRQFCSDAEENLKACLNESRVELLGTVLEWQAELLAALGRNPEKGEYYKKAAEAYLRAMKASSGKDREKLCTKYFDTLARCSELKKGTVEERKCQLINLMDIISSNVVFSKTAEVLIEQLAESLFKDLRDLTGYFPGVQRDRNLNPGLQCYFVLLALMLQEYVSFASFGNVESDVSILCLPENRENHKLTLEAAQKLLAYILRISQQEAVPIGSFFEQCRSKENNETLQRCVSLLTKTLEELPSRKMEAEILELRRENQLLKDKFAKLEAQVAMLLSKQASQSPPISPRFGLERKQSGEIPQIPQSAVVSKITPPYK